MPRVYCDWRAAHARREQGRSAAPAAVIECLTRHRGWLTALDRNSLYSPRTEERIHDVACWALRLLAASATTDLRGWRTRGKCRQTMIDDPIKASKSKQGLRAIVDLVDLAISELAALPQSANQEVLRLPGVASGRKVSAERLVQLRECAAKARAAKSQRMRRITRTARL